MDEMNQKGKKGFRARVVLVVVLIFLVYILNAAYVFGASLVDGKLSNALSFDGVGDYVEVTSDGTGTFDSQEYTISTWVNLNTVSDNIDQVIFSYDSTSYSQPYYAAHMRFVSGPSNLGLVSNTGELGSLMEDPDYTSLGTVDLSNLTNADIGTYVFEYIVAF